MKQKFEAFCYALGFALSLFYWAFLGVIMMETKLIKKTIEYDLQEITELLDGYKLSLEAID